MHNTTPLSASTQTSPQMQPPKFGGGRAHLGGGDWNG